MLCSPLAHALAAEATAIEPSLGYALAASGRVWDDTLNKMASYRELLHHIDETIHQRWTQSSENEFGRLF